MNRRAKFILLTGLFIATAILAQTLKSLLTGEEVRSPEGAGIAAVHGPAKPARSEVREATKKQVQEGYGNLPLSFEANQGQTDGRVKFLARGSGYALFLTSNEAVWVLPEAENKSKARGSADLFSRSAVFPGFLRSRDSKATELKNSSALPTTNAKFETRHSSLVTAFQAAELKSNSALPARGRADLSSRSAVFSGFLRSRDSKAAELKNSSALPALPRLETLNSKAEIRESAISNRQSQISNRQFSVRMKLLGSNPHAQVAGLEELPGKSNYFMGSDPKKWRTHIPTYRKVAYRQMYPGIDLVYYGNQRQLEYDFVVAPGADPKAITLGIEGTVGARHGLPLRIDSQGDLVVSTEGVEIRFRKPRVYQTDNGQPTPDPGLRTLVDGRYVLKGKHEVGFQVAPYDTTRALVIDPVLSYSTYLGGSDFDVGLGIAVDFMDNTYVTGFTCSTNFPTANAFQATLGGSCDVFVTKLNPAGSALLYSTYLGGSGFDAGLGITVDRFGNAYVAGDTDSSDFPTANPVQATLGGGCDAFVTKLNRTGSALLYSTYLGGSGLDFARGITVDRFGNAYVTGETVSPDFPTANPLQANLGGDLDAFVTKLNPAGSALLYSTFLGGSDRDVGFGIAADRFGNAYVTGETFSIDFPTANPLQVSLAGDLDAFVTKLNPAGSALLYSTYLGGSGTDVANAIAVDQFGNAYVAGETFSPDFPTANPLQAILVGGLDAFVTKLNPAGSALLFSTYLGGSGDDEAFGIAVGNVNVYVTGLTDSPDFPMANPLQAILGGGTDAFVTKLNPVGSALLFSTYLGGSGGDEAFGIAVGNVNVYITGFTDSTDFPTAHPVQASLGGDFDAFVTKLRGGP